MRKTPTERVHEAIVRLNEGDVQVLTDPNVSSIILDMLNSGKFALMSSVPPNEYALRLSDAINKVKVKEKEVGTAQPDGD